MRARLGVRRSRLGEGESRESRDIEQLPPFGPPTRIQRNYLALES